MRKSQVAIAFSGLAAVALIFSSSLMAAKPAKPILVRIDDTPDGPPKITVKGAPDGYDVYTGLEVANPDIEDGGLITLFGVDQGGLINPSGSGWRFVDATLPSDTVFNATDIVWIDHDFLLFGDGDLQIGFNTREDGLYYRNPDLVDFDDNAGPATNKWVTVYADATIVVEFKSRTP